MSLTIIILAAGKGTRMGSNIPKVMHPVAGVPMIEYLLEVSQSLSDDVRLVINSDLEKYIELNPLTKKYNYETVIQTDLSGTGNAVSCAVSSREVKENILVLYGDSPLIELDALEEMLNMISINDKLSVINLGFYTTFPHGYGRMITVDNYLVDIVEEKSATESQKEINLCNSGIMLIKSEVLKELLPQINNDNKAKEYYLTDVIKIANQSGYSCGFTVADEYQIMGVNSQGQLAEVNFIVQTNMREKAMKNGVIMLDPQSTFLSRDTKIGAGSIIEPFVFIGLGVEIGEGCTIKSHSYIEGAKIEDNCSVGPFARIRPETTLQSGVSIGNFVEVKNSTIKSGSKASHLSYIGDTDIGSRSNIGAGVVFCNYDGVNKHRSSVGEGVFIGSNSAIISPCNIEDDALIAAGSVITKDVLKNDLAVARSRQTNISDKGMAERKMKKYK